MKNLSLSIFILLLIPVVILAQEDYKKYPGYVDLSELESFLDSEETVEVFINKALLRLVASVTKEEDPELHNLLKNLALIRVEKFTVADKEINVVKAFISKIAKKLDDDKWDKLVRVKQKGEQVEIFSKYEGDDVVGLLIMVLEDDNAAVFVNIVGKIDINQLGKLSRKFDIPELDSLHRGNDKKRK